LLAIGGNLHPQTLLNAYAKGIFPWFNPGDPILWWHPNPRLVLFPHEIHVARRLKPLWKRRQWRVVFNRDFPAVLNACAAKRGPRRTATWITAGLKDSFIALHRRGFAHSVEVRDAGDDRLLGGLYGMALGKIFFGESMFSHVPNASKFALIELCQRLAQRDFLLLDCQVESEHLKTLGARALPRAEFLRFLRRGGCARLQPVQL
jgi:leucyl/phenylalanyl-tRNA--protein transferase